LLMMEGRIDGAIVEGATVDESSGDDGSCLVNRPLTRLRSDGPSAGGVSFEGGGSSEGSMPSSSYERRNK